MTTAEMAIQKGGAQSSLLKTVAEKYGLEAGKFYGMVKTTIFPTKKGKNGEADFVATDEMIMAFLSVANEYDLNPLLREIYPFIDSNGNLRVIVGIDGWIKVVQANPQYDGHKFVPHLDADQKLYAVTCEMFRKDRTRAISMTEYMHECKRDTDPWTKWPSRMLHHKAFIQTARYAFGMNRFIDDDEADRLTAIDVTTRPLEEPRRLSEAAKPVEITTTSATATADKRVELPKDKAVKDYNREEYEEHMRRAVEGEGNNGAADENDIKSVWNAAFPKGLSKADVNGMVRKKFNVERVQGLNKAQVTELIGDLQAI